jgi:copper(I)-binding protein
MSQTDEDMEGASAASLPQSTLSTPESANGCAALHVVGAWARPTVAAMPNSAAYMLLLNLTDQDEVLVSGETNVATVVELHEMTMGESDVMIMQPIEGGIIVPAGGVTILQPGGLHVMIIGLNQELHEGESINLTLTFAESGSSEFIVPINEPPSSEGMSNMHN